MCAYSVFNTFPVYPLSAKPLILLAFCRYRYHTSLFYPFGFSEFEEQRAIKKEPETEKEYKGDKNDHNDSQRDKKPERKTFTTPLKEKTKKEKKAAKLEEKIQIYEKEISDTEKELEKPEIFSDYSKITEIQARIDELKTLRDDALSEWATISEELEKMKI